MAVILEKQFCVSPPDVVYADFTDGWWLPVANAGTTQSNLAQRHTVTRGALELFTSSEMRSFIIISNISLASGWKAHEILAIWVRHSSAACWLFRWLFECLYCWVLSSLLVLSPTMCIAVAVVHKLMGYDGLLTQRSLPQLNSICKYTAFDNMSMLD